MCVYMKEREREGASGLTRSSKSKERIKGNNISDHWCVHLERDFYQSCSAANVKTEHYDLLNIDSAQTKNYFHSWNIL